MRREVRKPEKIPVRAVTVQHRPPSRASRLLANERAVMAITMVVLVVLGTVLIWPESTDELVYEGEVWGDFRAEGNLTGRQVEEDGEVFIHANPTLGSEGVRAVVSNLTGVHLRTLGTPRNVDMDVPLPNGTFEVLVTDGSLEGAGWDMDLRCVYSDLNGSFPGTTVQYRPDMSVSSVNGTASIRPGSAFALYVSSGICTIDGTVHIGVIQIDLLQNETAEVNITGRGSIRVGTGFHPHINGTLTIWDFKRYKGWWSDDLDSIFFEGPDIEVAFGEGADWEEGVTLPYSPWTMEVTIQHGTIVRTSEDLSTAQLAIYLMVLVLLSFPSSRAYIVHSRNP
jgi:hypothetical protein